MTQASAAPSAPMTDPGPPDHLLIQTVTGCNGRCRFCPNCKTRRSIPAGRRMDWGLYRTVIDQCLELGVHRFSVYLMNEPMLDPAGIDAAALALLADPALPMATLSLPLRSVDEMMAPSVVKVVTDARGDALYFSRSPVPANVAHELSGWLGSAASQRGEPVP